MFNLVPAIGELNGDRIHKLHGVIPKEERKYGACDFEVSDSIAEPMKSIRGDIARVWLYMLKKYRLELSDDFIDLMKQWNKDDPVDTAEKLRHEVISREMGWKNPYIVKEIRSQAPGCRPQNSHISLMTWFTPFICEVRSTVGCFPNCRKYT